LKNVAQRRFGTRFDGMLMEPYREFLLLWMQAFEECSVDPDTDRIILCPHHRAHSASTLPELAEIILEQSQGKLKDMGSRDVAAVQNLQSEIRAARTSCKVAEGQVAFVCNCCISFKALDANDFFPCDLSIFCIRFRFFSGWHVSLYIVLSFGIWLATLLHLQAKHIVGVGVDTACVMIFAMISQTSILDEAMRLEVEHANLLNQQQNVQDLGERIRLWDDKSQSNQVAKLWSCKTMNMLNLFDEVWGLYFCPACYDSIADEDELHKTLCRLNIKLDKALDDFGDSSLYFEEGVVDDTLLTSAADQAANNIMLIGRSVQKGEVQKVEALLESLCSFVFLHIKRAKNLPNMDKCTFCSNAKDLTDSFVLVRFPDIQERDCPRTSVIKDNLNPEWDEVFFCPVDSQKRTLTLEVYDSGEDQWVCTSKESIGYVVVDFGKCHGRLLNQLASLRDSQTCMKLGASIEYSYCFLSSIRELATFRKGQVSQHEMEAMHMNMTIWENPSSSNMANLDSFLGIAAGHTEANAC